MNDAQQLATICVSPLHDAIYEIVQATVCDRPVSFRGRLDAALRHIARAQERIEVTRAAIPPDLDAGT